MVVSGGTFAYSRLTPVIPKRGFFSRCDSFSPISSTMLLQRRADMVDDDFGMVFFSVLFVGGVSSGW